LGEVTREDVRLALDRNGEGKAMRPNRKPHPDKRSRKGKAPCELVPTARARTPDSVNRIKAALSSFYKHAIVAGIVSSNPCTGIPARAEHDKRTRWLTDYERAQLLKACRASDCEKLYLHLLLLAALMTGARRGELLALRWEQIDFSARTATLARTKNGDARTLSFPMPVIEEMLRHRKAAGLVFADERNVFSVASIKRPWLTALKEAKIEGFRFYDLRHSAASYLAMSGASLLEIAKVLGHRSMQTTKRYAHLSVAHKQALTDRVLGVL
jgi:integrase